MIFEVEVSRGRRIMCILGIMIEASFRRLLSLFSAVLICLKNILTLLVEFFHNGFDSFVGNVTPTPTQRNIGDNNYYHERNVPLAHACKSESEIRNSEKKLLHQRNAQKHKQDREEEAAL